MRRLHFFVGILGLILFIASGLYMHFGYDHLRGMSDMLRLQFRSTHIYLLFGSLINLGLGIYLQQRTGWRSWLQGVGSMIVLTTPVFATIGFLTEPWLADLERPYSRMAAYGCLAGMMMHLTCSIRLGTSKPPTEDKICD